MQKQWLSVVFIQKNKESRSWVWIITQNELSTRWHYSTVFRRNAAVSASNVSLKSCHFITVRKNRLFIRGFIKPVCWWNMNRLIFRLKSQQDGTPECCHISAWLAESSKNCHSVLMAVGMLTGKNACMFGLTFSPVRTETVHDEWWKTCSALS